ncbi:MAG: hypothetical protein AAF092_10810 [Pseudomonadota bacterium]
MTLLIEPGGQSTRHLEGALHFVDQLARSGVPALLPAAALPPDAPRLLRYESTKWLRDDDGPAPGRVVVMNANEVSAPALARLQLLYAKHTPELLGLGRFATPQEQIITQSKLAYAAGREPTLFDLAAYQPSPLMDRSPFILLDDPSALPAPRPQKPRLTLCLLDEALEAPQFAALLGLLVHDPRLTSTLVVSSANYDTVVRLTGRRVRVLTFGETQPHLLARMTDILSVHGEKPGNGRLAATALATLMSGGVLIDATEAGSYAQADAPVVRAPSDLAGFITVLRESVLATLDTVQAAVAESPWLAANRLAPLLSDMLSGAVPAQPAVQTSTSEPRQVLFVPTNGVGLGHAQRSSLIAAEMPGTRPVAFAAFPSCVAMLRQKGFATLPLVAKSAQHKASYANDLLNYARLSHAVAPGSGLVFDGAYIFDSILRLIREKDLRATWIRRGLWQPGQIDRMPLERENDFTNVIVPDEAFPELNTAYTHGDTIHRVAPIVQLDPMTPAERGRARKALIKRFQPDARKILVTMLGGGVAADRATQIQSLCALCQEHPDWLHLIVVWPQGLISSNLAGWTNSKVVRTQSAVRLAQISDLVVSATGYNSFHELMYHKVPSILMPQMAGYMDDQARRAEAAGTRELAVVVDEGTDLLRLRKEVTRLMQDGATDDMRAAFDAVTLPDVGNSAAAALIEGSQA